MIVGKVADNLLCEIVVEFGLCSRQTPDECPRLGESNAREAQPVPGEAMQPNPVSARIGRLGRRALEPDRMIRKRALPSRHLKTEGLVLSAQPSRQARAAGRPEGLEASDLKI